MTEGPKVDHAEDQGLGHPCPNPRCGDSDLLFGRWLVQPATSTSDFQVKRAKQSRVKKHTSQNHDIVQRLVSFSAAIFMNINSEAIQFRRIRMNPETIWIIPVAIWEPFWSFCTTE